MRPKAPGTAFGKRPPINFQDPRLDKNDEIDQKYRKELDGLSQIGRDLSVL